MQKDPDFAAKYKSIVTRYVNKGYARKLTRAEAEIKGPRTWYLPHFGVKNPSKPGKLRLVFDAAAEVSGVSLNSLLLKGPDDYRPLVAVLSNFRMRPIAVTGDIKEMFYQVLIRKEDQDSQRFLWRHNRDMPIDVYVMEAMTFGASCSPCSANFVKNLNASRFSTENARAVEAITKNHYVDDYVDSFENIDEAIEVTNAVVTIHKSGGFVLRNFASNADKLIQDIVSHNQEEFSRQAIDLNMDSPTEKVLGLYWDSQKDVFVFHLNFPRVSQAIIKDNRRPTKREFLSLTMSIFDPFGMIANFLLHLKLMLRSIWRHGIGWDEPIPDEVFTQWTEWKTELPILMRLTVPRCHHLHLSKAERVGLHTFVDASEEAFSAVTYFRVEFNGEVRVSFVYGKTRASPKKLLSIPRLELTAAVLGTRLSNAVKEHHDLPIAEHVFWSDSKTVLHWLRSDPRRHEEFVAFRIAEVLDRTQINQWRWVPSNMNPADDGTRARHPPKFQLDNKWINGPAFLTSPEVEWPQLPDDLAAYECQDELRPKHILNVTLAENACFDESRFSTYLKLQRTMSWVLRFLAACRGTQIEPGELSVSELASAERLIVRQIQREAYGPDIDKLRRNLPIGKNSKVYKLTPYLDDSGILRIMGRIDAATTVPFSTRRPVILPKSHRVTRLLIDQFHSRLGHQGDDTVVNEIRQSFWIVGLRDAIRMVKNECQQCRIRCARPSPPLMGQLPKDRLTPHVRPFTFTGLDYFGPVAVTIGRRREKRWIALFTCLTIRAVHLEVAADLSTDACILCVRNFVNRRGVPVRIRSDNGTNFVGAKNELHNNSIFDNDVMKAELSAKGIEWVFNCPANPHAGGCWERLVQSIKRVLSRTLSEVAPRFETLQSALIEAENIVNSRPLTYLPVSTEDEEPLTPNHFILGSTSSTQTPGPIVDRALCLRKQWRISQQLKDRFWRRWTREYLPVLTKRCRGFEKVPPLKIGDVVLVCDVDVPRSQWAKGRVVNVFPGADGQVRLAEVKTATGVI